MAIAFTYTEATNTIVVTGGTSGTPAVFADFVTADRAGTATLLVATAGLSPTLALTYQIRPVEDMALLITFTIAAKSVHTDYIFITGTDWRGAAQTESIDVSAGNGVYASTKYFRTITNIDCSDGAGGGGTQWADGTVAVTQPQWGVSWDYGNGQYLIDARFNVGDGSTATHFSSSKEHIFFSSSTPALSMTSTANSTLYLGLTGGEGTSSYGSVISLNNSNEWVTILSFAGICLFYGSVIRNNQAAYGDITFSHASTIINDCMFEGFKFVTASGANTWKRTKLAKNTRSFRVKASITADDILIGHYFSSGIYYDYNPSCTLSNVTVLDDGSVNNDVHAAALVNDSNLIDCTFSTLTGGTFTADLYEKYTCNIHVADKDGSNLASVVVLCEEQDGTDAFSVSTDANGDIAEQTVQYKRHYKSGTVQNETYSPHKFTLSKAGYETLVLDAITVDSPVDWHLELQPAGGAGAKNQQIGIGVQI